jgi:hypothetical protein
MNSEKDGISGVKNAYFRFFGGWFTFVRLALAKIRDGLGQLPEWVVESPIELGSAVNPNCFCAESRQWILCVLSGRISTFANDWLKKNEKHTEGAPPQSRRVKGIFVHYAP